MADMGWMVDAACQDRPDLPWTGPVRDDWTRYPVPTESLARMRAVCADCPALRRAGPTPGAAEVSAGFWAGRWRHRQTVLRVVEASRMTVTEVGDETASPVGLSRVLRGCTAGSVRDLGRR